MTYYYVSPRLRLDVLVGPSGVSHLACASSPDFEWEEDESDPDWLCICSSTEWEREKRAYFVGLGPLQSGN
jgi:hypothetical protein